MQRIYCQQIEKLLAMIGAILRMPESLSSGWLVLILTSFTVCKLAVNNFVSVILKDILLHDVIRPLATGEVVFSLEKASAIRITNNYQNFLNRALPIK
jgi:hypothetical protein